MLSHSSASHSGEAAASTGRGNGVATWCVAIVTAMYALVLLPAWYPQFLSTETIRDGLDSGWAFALNEFHARGMQFGQDVIFTYGPLGFFESGFYHPDTYPVVLVRTIAFAVVFWFCLWSYGRRSRLNVVLLGLGMLVLTTLAGVTVRATAHQPEYFTCALLLLTSFHRPSAESRRAWWLLIASAALAGLIKFSYLAGGLAVVGVVSIDQLRRRRFPTALLAFASAYLFFHVVSGQHPSSLMPYLVTSIDLAAGYSVSMATPGAGFEVIAFLIAGAMLVLATASSLAGSRVRRLLFGSGLAAVVWVLFKQGYVRHDPAHTVNADVELLMIAVACLPIVVTGLPRVTGPLFWSRACAIAAILAWVSCYQFFREGPVGQLRLAKHQIVSNVTAAARLLAHGTEPLRDEYARAFRQLAQEHPIPPVAGIVDIYPWDVWLPLVHGVEYRPRPVFQSYAAYTPSLAEKNARHLTGISAPETVLFQVKTIDDRLATMDDALLWPILIDSFTLKSIDGQQLTLAQAAPPRLPVTRMLDRFVVRVGEPFELPRHDGLVLFAANLKSSFTGKVWSVTYQAPVVAIEVWTGTGAPQRFRYLRSLQDVPFLISPLVTDTESFVELLRGQMSSDRSVHRVALRVNSRDEWKINPLVEVTLTSVDLDRATTK